MSNRDRSRISHGAFYTRKQSTIKRSGGGADEETPLTSGSMIQADDADNVTWEPNDSRGDPLTDSSTHDMSLLDGLTPLGENELELNTITV